MLQWPARGTRFSLVRCRSLRTYPRCRLPYYQRRFATAAVEGRRQWFEQAFPIFENLGFPPQLKYRKGIPQSWMRHVEQALPVHLRRGPSINENEACLGPADTAAILLAAHRLKNINDDAASIPLLSYLGNVEHRWDAVIWLVKHVIEGTNPVSPQSDSVAMRIEPWTNQGSLRSITGRAFAIEPNVTLYDSPSLDELTSGKAFAVSGSRATIQKDFVGLLWHSLGEMILACEDGMIQPEILELIAYLHHRELMPTSIYSPRPPASTSAIQQPPLLHLLSPQILRSLSDAAWKAQEQLFMKEAETRGAYYRAIPPTAYRVHVEGLRPEVWLELVLWSCLQGPWLDDGLSILYRICVHQAAWYPVPWRSHILAGQAPDDTMDRFLDTSDGAADEMDQTYAQVRRTISSEVVDAYIDALLSVVHESNADTTLVRFRSARLLTAYKLFLARSDTKPSAGSWDSVVLRDYESRHLQQAPSTPGGRDDRAYSTNKALFTIALAESNSPLALGLYHNALRQAVENGDLKASSWVFEDFKAYTLANTAVSAKMSPKGSKSQQMSNEAPLVSRVELNAVLQEAQIPATVLAPFLELLMDSKAYDFGKSLLNEHSFQTYTIPKAMYQDPVLSPSLARLAAETGDRALYSEVVNAGANRKHGDTEKNTRISEGLSRAFLKTQINMGKWSAARKLLEFMTSFEYRPNMDNLADLSRVMLKAQASGKEGDLEQAKEMFSKIISEWDGRPRVKNQQSRLHYRIQDTMRPYNEHAHHHLLLMVLASLDTYWSGFCNAFGPLITGHHEFTLRARAFNLIFEGVLAAFGSNVGRRVLEQFWPQSIQALQLGSAIGARARVAFQDTRKHRAVAREDRQRTVVCIPGRPDLKVVIYGGLRPNARTFTLLFNQLLKEKGLAPGSANVTRGVEPEYDAKAAPPNTVHEARADVSGQDPFAANLVWAVRGLHRMGVSDESIIRDLNATLGELNMQSVRQLLPDLFEKDSQGNDISGGT